MYKDEHYAVLKMDSWMLKKKRKEEKNQTEAKWQTTTLLPEFFKDWIEYKKIFNVWTNYLKLINQALLKRT